MAKKTSPNNITNLNEDWGLDTNTNLPFSGTAVQNFIKSFLRNVTAAAWFNPVDYTMYFFANAEDRDAFASDTSLTGLVMFSCPMNFSSTMFRVNITNNTGATIINTATNAGTLPLSTSFVVQTKDITDSTWTDTQVGAYVTIYIDRNVTGNYVPITQRALYASGSTIEMDVFPELVPGTSRVRFTFEAEDGSVTSSLVYTITMSELYVELFNNTWYAPILQANSDSWYLGGFRIAGAGYKTLHLGMFNTSGTQVATIQVPIGTTNAYASTPFYYRFDRTSPILGLDTGIYKVRAYVTTDTLTSEVVEYNIMYVTTSDTGTAKLVVANDIAEKVYNYSTTMITKYAAYNGGLSTCDVTITYSRWNGDTKVDSDTPFVLAGVQTGVEQQLDYYAEWNVTGDGYAIAFEIALGSSKASSTVPLDNSSIFPPTTGYDFYLNASTRSNSDENKDKVVNAADGSEITPTWSMIDFIDGVDAWTVDDEGRKCLLIPAGCSMSLPYQLISKDNMTLEMAYKVANVSDYDENVITIASNPTAAGFRGLRIKTNTITLHSATDTTDEYDHSRGTKVEDEQLIHLLITINPNFEGTNKLVKGFVNGDKNFEFTYGASTDWPVNANLVIAPQKSDVYLYFVRHYPTAIADPMARNNYVNSLSTLDQRKTMDELLKSVLDAGQTNIDFEMVKNNEFNFFVITMEDGATIPSKANGWGKKTTGYSTLEMHYGKHPEWDWRLGPMETTGQGTTSMDYFRWNIRWRIDKTDDTKKVPVQYLVSRTKVGPSYQYTWGIATSSKTVIFDGEGNHPAVKRITAKINQASSMQSHKMGATKAYSDLQYRLGLLNEAQSAAVSGGTPVPTTAVYQYPAFGFEYNPTYGTYTFCGLFTIGPDKGDKPTFGFDTTEDELISMEGTDHSQLLAKFAYPLNSDVQFLASEEGISIVKGTGSYETGLEVGNCHGLSTDKTSDQDAVRAILNTEFKPAYELVWNNSTLIFGVALGTYASTAAATLTYINSHLEAFRNTRYDERFAYSDMQFWIDGEYKLYYYDIVQGKYVAGQTLGTPTGSTIEAKNNYFKAQRRTAFKASAENYWDIQDALYHFDFLIITGATDNFAKNTYPYKMKTFAHGGRYKWRQDDLDSLFDIDNSGADTKPYYIEFKDAEGGSPFFAGSASIFWNLIFECYWDDYTSTVSGNVESGLLSMGRSILEAMRDLSGASNTYDGFVNYIGLCFWDKAQNYFPQSAYSVDANFKYEQAWLNNGQNVDPLSQALGNHFSAEKLWVKRRAVYMLSLFHAGPFGDYSDTSLGTISFRPQGISTNLVPAVWLYPALGVGQGMLNGSRTEPGEPQAFSTTGDGNTTFYIQASNYLSSLGDLKNLVLGSQYIATLQVNGKKLTSFKIGDETAGAVTTNVPGLIFPNNKCLETIDARNASSIRGSLDLTNCTRLRNLLLAGSSVTGVELQHGSKIESLALPASIQNISFVNLKHLDTEGFSMVGYENLLSIRVENSLVNALSILKAALPNANNLTALRLIWGGDIIDHDGSLVNALATVAEGDYIGLDDSGSMIPRPVVEGSLSCDAEVGVNAIFAINEAFENVTLNVDRTKAFIDFADSTVASIAVANWDTNGDNKISLNEAAAVTNLGTLFRAKAITTFNELRFFSGLTGIAGGSTTTGAFGSCSSLISVTLPTSVTTISGYAFGECVALTSINLENVTSIRNRAFWKTRALSLELNCPALTVLDAQAFQESGISKIISLGNITSVGLSVFEGCKNLSEINIPESATTINTYAFRGCSALRIVNLPNTLTTIGSNAFYGCTSLAEIAIPLSVQSIASGAFQSCTNLSSVDLSHVQSLGQNAFRSDTALPTEMIIGATSVGDSAFRACLLERIILPNVETVATYAFNACKNAYVDIGPKCTEIGGNAISSESVDSYYPDRIVICRATIPPTLGVNNFRAYSGAWKYDTTIYVPYSSDHSILNAYKTATNWSQYESSIYELTESGEIPE